MQLPLSTALFNAVDATWAPKAFHKHEGWLIREGAGGGQRVSSATQLYDTKVANIPAAEDKMRSLGQTPLFMIRNSDTKLDAALQALGYEVVDPVDIMAAPTGQLLRSPPNTLQNIRLFDVPNATARAVWAAGGINRGRLDVMARVKTPKTILSIGEMGVAFAAAYQDIAMVHAVEVAPKHRRKGVANALIYKACQWAMEQNCSWVAVLTVHANIPAHTLYENLGMVTAAAYHYRRKA